MIESFSTYPFMIFSKEYHEKYPSNAKFPFKGDTVIGNDVWIGYNAAFFMPGVKVSDGAIIGTNALVTKNVGPYEIWGGNPAKRKSCCHEIVSMYKDNGVDPIEIASEKMRQFIIELSKLEATPKRFLNDMFSIWMMFIKDPNSIPPEFLSIPEVKEVMDELTIMSSDPETRALYKARLQELNDIRVGMSVKFEEGLEKGKKEEREKAEKEKAELKAEAEKREKELKAKAEKEKRESAKTVLSMGLSIEQVSSITGLPIEEINEIKRHSALE